MFFDCIYVYCFVQKLLVNESHGEKCSSAKILERDFLQDETGQKQSQNKVVETS